VHRIGLIGFGKIAIDRHLPTIMAHPAFELVGIADKRGREISGYGVPILGSHTEMFSALPDLDTVAICTPPAERCGIAIAALAAGMNVLLEKPPAAGVAELAILRSAGEQAGRVLFTAWHSQHNAAVARARLLLEGAAVEAIDVRWKEDVQRYHPNQDWIWRAGGFGVFDPGINALSILTDILPRRVFVRGAVLSIPVQADMPIAANIEFGLVGRDGGCGGAAFDWRSDAGEIREITVTTRAGDVLLLDASGRRLSVNSVVAVDGDRDEYGRLYEHFHHLLEQGMSDFDPEPSLLVADAFQLGTRVTVDAVL
jgi:D-galactose 1-dehydrogenase